jgi:hypothetical protein
VDDAGEPGAIDPGAIAVGAAVNVVYRIEARAEPFYGLLLSRGRTVSGAESVEFDSPSSLFRDRIFRVNSA